jgi:hypothetical protein
MFLLVTELRLASILIQSLIKNDNETLYFFVSYLLLSFIFYCHYFLNFKIAKW